MLFWLLGSCLSNNRTSVPVFIDTGFADVDADVDADLDVDVDADSDVDTALPVDQDQDGFPLSDDCDDTSAVVHPGAPEVCDGIDNDCDEEIDEEGVGIFRLFEDIDADGFGVLPGREFIDPSLCPLPAGWVAQAGDCEPDDPLRHPDAADDTCDGVDQDCDGLPDDGNPQAMLWFYDRDGDGVPGDSVFGCPQPGASPVGGDCDDHDPEIHPGATEIWRDGVDQDCDGNDADPPDRDGDGFDASEDCDDLSVSIHPQAIEACGNNLDDDCDGRVDVGCEVDTPPVVDPPGCSTSHSSGSVGLFRRR